MNGSELRKQREAAGVRAADLAHVLGVTRSAITHLEARDNVQPATAARFLESVKVLAAERHVAVTAKRRAELARVGRAALDQGLDLLIGSAIGGN